MWYRKLLYRNQRQVYGLAYWLSRRFTTGGKFALGCFILSATFGLDTNQTTAYQAFTFLLAAFACGWLWILFQFFRKPGRFLTIQRRMPRFGTAGQPVRYDVIATNSGRRPQRSWSLLENLQDPRPTFAEFAIKPRGNQRTLMARFDWLLGYTRWWQLLARGQIATIEEHFLPDVPPNGTAETPVTFTPKHRGRVHFVGYCLARPDIFGLIRSLWYSDLPQSMLVLPKRYHLPRLLLPGTREYQPAGVALASAVGQSDEFIALRDYRPGDPLRHIHWNSVAKQDKLIVREHEDEFFVRHALILDTFAPPEAEEVFEEAVSVAASFVCTIQTQESLLDLMFVGAEAYCFTAGRGVGNADRMLEVLAGVRLCANKPFPALESLVMRHAGRVSGCVCIFIEWDEDRHRLVKRLQAMNVPLRVCVITEDDPTAPDLDLGPMRDQPENFHHLKAGSIQEVLAQW